jgi:hypothetical protein
LHSNVLFEAWRLAMKIRARASTLAAVGALLLVGCSNDSGGVASNQAGWLPDSSLSDGAPDTSVPETGTITLPDAAPPNAWDSLPPECAAAAEKGVTYLVSQQKTDGSWGTTDPYMSAATGLAVVKLETYAIEKGFDPFSPKFIYNTNVVQGLTYLFNTLTVQPMSGAFDTNGDGKGVAYADPAGTADDNYVGAIILMAVTAGKGTTQVVNAPSSPVNGWTFATVAQDMVDWFSQCQVSSQGGWRYNCPSPNADNSVSQYVSLGLEYASHPDYAFKCTIPAAVPTGLWTWVGSIQNTTPGTDLGGSGYTDANTDVNPYKTGALLQELAFLGKGPTSAQSQAALQYLDNHWADPITGTPAQYMTMWAIMKGLVGQGVDKVGTHDWYQEYCDLLVSQQNADGSWPLAQYDTAASDGILSDTWALLILERAAPPPPPGPS